MPVPDSEMVAGEPVALLATDTLPVSEPAAVGENTTLKVKVWPAESVTGVPAPTRLNPAPVSEMLEIVTLEFPLLVTVTVCVADDPVFTLPNARLVVLNASVWVAVTPVPLNAIVAGEFGALLTMETAPVTEPADAGENTILKVVDWLGLNEIGNASVLVLKPLPVTLTCEMLKVPVPLFVS